MYPVTDVESLIFASTFNDRRDACDVTRNSVSCDCGTVLLNGMLAKFVPSPVPVFVLRKIPVTSANPPGVKSAAPILNESGCSTCVMLTCCLSGACAFGTCGAAASGASAVAGIAAVAVAKGGTAFAVGFSGV